MTAAVAQGAPTYRELLGDPLWQRRRLEVLSGAGWCCSRCRGTKKQLQVHHRRYVTGRKPWEYSDAELVVLCDDCHELQHMAAPTEDDEKRELTISRLYDELISCVDPAEQRTIMAAMQSLVAARSPEQARRMEKAMGIR